MILCLGCRKLWPVGTTWCGTCRKTLGKRLCPGEHENPLFATCCTICGSTRLTPGVASLRLRLISYLVVGIGLAKLLPFVEHLLTALWKEGYRALLDLLFGPILTLAVISLFLSWILGHKAGKLIGKFWMALLHLVLSLLEAAESLVPQLGGKKYKRRH